MPKNVLQAYEYYLHNFDLVRASCHQVLGGTDDYIVVYILLSG